MKLKLSILDIEKAPFRQHTALIKSVIQEICFGDLPTKYHSIEEEVIMVPPLKQVSEDKTWQKSSVVSHSKDPSFDISTVRLSKTS